MKRTTEPKDSVLKPLLADLAAAKLVAADTRPSTEKGPVFGKTSTNQPALYQDPGNGYNQDLSDIQD